MLFCRPWYKEVVSFWKKDIVIVLDISSTMQNYLWNVKASITGLLNTLGPNDMVMGFIVLRAMSDYSKRQTLITTERYSSQESPTLT